MNDKYKDIEQEYRRKKLSNHFLLGWIDVQSSITQLRFWNITTSIDKIQLELQTREEKLFFFELKSRKWKWKILIKNFCMCKKGRGQSIPDPYFILNPAGSTGGEGGR